MGSNSEAGSNAGSSSETGEKFVVERILEKRLVAGKKEYLVKWMGYGDEDNTWDLEDVLDCPELIAEFEQQWKEKRKEEAAKKTTTKKRRAPACVATEGSSKRTRAQTTASKKAKAGKGSQGSSSGVTGAGGTGFNRGLQPEKIIGSTLVTGNLMFLMKWKDINEADLVPALQANLMCPQVVISYYEERVAWNTNDDE